MYSAFIIRFATDVLAQGQQQKPKKCIQFLFLVLSLSYGLGFAGCYEGFLRGFDFL